MTFRKVAGTTIAVALAGAALFCFSPVGRDVLFHLMPMRWTGEAKRLAAALEIAPGLAIADVGAGDGSLIIELSQLVGPRGRAFATERSERQRQRIRAGVKSSGLQVSVTEAADHVSNLPDACCDAITLRMVFHHFNDPASLARDLRRAVKAGGRIGVIDFKPGALPHLTADHGVSPEQVTNHLINAGFALTGRSDDWGGRSYLLVFRAR